MHTTQTEALIGMAAVLGMLVLLVLPALIGIAHERRIDRQLKRAEEQRQAGQRPTRQRDARGGIAARGTARAA